MEDFLDFCHQHVFVAISQEKRLFVLDEKIVGFRRKSMICIEIYDFHRKSMIFIENLRGGMERYGILDDRIGRQNWTTEFVYGRSVGRSAILETK